MRLIGEAHADALSLGGLDPETRVTPGDDLRVGLARLVQARRLEILSDRRLPRLAEQIPAQIDMANRPMMAF